MRITENQRKYLTFFIIGFCLIISFRLLETGLVYLHYGLREHLLSSELLGIGYDILTISLLLLLYYPVYWLMNKRSSLIANWVLLSFIALFGTIHILILKYFFYQLIPLDASLFKYSFDEVFFTVTTSGINYSKTITFIIFLLLFIIVGFIYLNRKTISDQLVRLVYKGIFWLMPVLLLLTFFTYNNQDIFANNKSIYFYAKTAIYLVEGEFNTKRYSASDANQFQMLYPQKEFISKEYPLLHKSDTTNPLGIYLQKFDSAPNIVVLIIEGLNDDFIHKYKGIDLMPFLSNLKDKSLYWSKCFTLGERSFAVIPSILGSLPYGQKGFLIEDRLPHHLSLVSVLHANNYYTSYFYGQGSWFHRKDRFFDYNDADLVFDNRKFSDKYQKIIVGSNNFFWGYNDKDLFNSSLEVLDTLPLKKRLNIYYTGTSHSPYQISNEAYYDKWFTSVLETVKNDSVAEFFSTYKKYIKSIAFVDDALKDFFTKYKERPEYSNTVFIITGDHPMSEIPFGNPLKRYHVPLIIYSEKLVEPLIFTGIVSHMDVPGSILSFLRPYGIKSPEITADLGDHLTFTNARDNQPVVFMNDNREVVDIYDEGYFLSQNQLYLVGPDFGLMAVKDKNKFKKLSTKLETFKKTSLYTCIEDKIIPDSLYCKGLQCSLLYSVNKTDTIHFDSEFQEITPSVKIGTDKNLVYDISFNYKGDVSDMTLVYQLMDKNDSVVYWRNTGIPENQYLFQVHIRIPNKDRSTACSFKSYFWKKNKRSFSFFNTHILIHGIPSSEIDAGPGK